jgi:hypothetical protein
MLDLMKRSPRAVTRRRPMARTSNPHPSTIPPGRGEAAPGGLRSWVLARPLLAYFAAAYALTALAAVVV